MRVDEFGDPGTLRERDGVEFVDASPVEHQDHFERYESIAGVVVTGVTDDRGRVLVLEHDQHEIPMLPYAEVGHDEEWVAAARGAVATWTGVEATIDEPVRVRHHTYRSGMGEETTGHDVVFAASPETTGRDPDTDHEWTAAWRDGSTLDLPADPDNDVLNDIRLFVE